MAGFDLRWLVQRPALALVVSVSCALAGCAGGGGGSKGGDPGAKALPAGQTCQSIKTDLDRMVGRGVQSSVEANSAGKKLSPAQKADADRYNELLAYYLGGRCHV